MNTVAKLSYNLKREKRKRKKNHVKDKTSRKDRIFPGNQRRKVQKNPIGTVKNKKEKKQNNQLT